MQIAQLRYMSCGRIIYSFIFHFALCILHFAFGVSSLFPLPSSFFPLPSSFVLLPSSLFLRPSSFVTRLSSLVFSGSAPALFPFPLFSVSREPARREGSGSFPASHAACAPSSRASRGYLPPPRGSRRARASAAGPSRAFQRPHRNKAA